MSPGVVLIKWPDIYCRKCESEMKSWGIGQTSSLNTTLKYLRLIAERQGGAR